MELPISYPTRGRVHLGVIEQFEQRLALPAIVDPDSPGEATLVSPLPALRPTDTILADNPYLTWQVTVSIETGDHAPMPGPRGLDGHALVPSDAESRETWVRPSRGGISYDSRKYDWVPANAIGEQRLARPRLRNLGLAAWVREMATQAGYETDISDAGMRGHLLASLWGSRRELAADVSGPFMNLVELFTRRGDSTLKAYPNGEGVLLHRTTGVLNYLGASSPWSSTSTADETRRLLDIHLQRGVLRRGLVLGCAICRDVAFVNVDDLGQRNRCQRCGALNDFTLQAWRQPLQDPDWYYELHPVVRDLVADNGHAPLWLAHHLASNAREYSDVTETILTIPGTRKAVAEADLIAVADGELITAEVKTNDELATGGSERVSAAEKRVLWAAVLRADQIVLATTQTAWKPSSIEALSRAIDTGDANRLWPPGARPALRLVTSIGTHSVSDTLVAPH